MKRIQVASIAQRILSSLIDLALIAGITCLFYFCVFGKAVSSVQHFDTLRQQIINEEKISYLYTNLEDDTPKTYLEVNPKAGEETLAKPVHDFYVEYLQKKDQKYTEYWYDTHVLYLDDYKGLYSEETISRPEIILFEWKDEKPEKKSSYTQEEFNLFYRSAYSSSLTELTYFDPIRSATTTIAWGNMRAILYASLIGTFIPCFIIPISLKNGKTIGKLVMRLVVLTDEGYEYKRYKHIFRYLSFYIIEFFGGVVTIGLTLIFTSLLALFTKKHRALHDYIAFSVVADEVHSVFYKDEEEEAKYQLLSQQKLEA
ncbi:MAG: RDD family protein [Bacilli bacterium]|nr:RDD family protein [Bacilli bacterium]